jgi:hypothetical protein
MSAPIIAAYLRDRIEKTAARRGVFLSETSGFGGRDPPYIYSIL